MAGWARDWDQDIGELRPFGQKYVIRHHIWCLVHTPATWNTTQNTLRNNRAHTQPCKLQMKSCRHKCLELYVDEILLSSILWYSKTHNTCDAVTYMFHKSNAHRHFIWMSLSFRYLEGDPSCPWFTRPSAAMYGEPDDDCVTYNETQWQSKEYAPAWMQHMRECGVNLRCFKCQYHAKHVNCINSELQILKRSTLIVFLTQ